MDAVGLDIATLPRDFVSFVTLVVLGFLSASLLRNLSRTVIVRAAPVCRARSGKRFGAPLV